MAGSVHESPVRQGRRRKETSSQYWQSFKFQSKREGMILARDRERAKAQIGDGFQELVKTKNV